MNEPPRKQHASIENVFVLGTGRCGTTTLIRACEYIENFSCGHETRSTLLGDERIAYPPHHIEADNRLTWFLPRLEKTFPAESTLFVHLKRNAENTARSFALRKREGIMRAYREGILMRGNQKTLHDEDIALAKDYIQCVNENIQAFLSNKPHVMQMDLETLNNDLPKLWRYINAKGNLESAITSTNIKHNTSQDYIKKKRRNRLKRFIPQKLLRKQI